MNIVVLQEKKKKCVEKKVSFIKENRFGKKK
jgi:hypothetical protein